VQHCRSSCAVGPRTSRGRSGLRRTLPPRRVGNVPGSGNGDREDHAFHPEVRQVGGWDEADHVTLSALRSISRYSSASVAAVPGSPCRPRTRLRAAPRTVRVPGGMFAAVADEFVGVHAKPSPPASSSTLALSIDTSPPPLRHELPPLWPSRGSSRTHLPEAASPGQPGGECQDGQ
jgi:hypothetical protein